MSHNSETAGDSKLQYLLDVVLQGGFLQHQGLGAVGKNMGKPKAKSRKVPGL